MSTYATTADVGDLYEGVLPDRTQALLDKAERLLARLVPDLVARVASAADAEGHIDQGLVRDTVVDAVLRVLENPKGLTSETDGDYSYRRSTGVGETGRVEFTAEELALLRGPLPDTSWSGVGAILLQPGMSAPKFPKCVPADPLAWSGDQRPGIRPVAEVD